MRYKCLVLDHDDTVVNSTAHVHYPSFVKVLSEIRPDTTLGLEEFYRKNFEPGILGLCKDILGFTDEEMIYEKDCWQNYVERHVPKTFDGMEDIIAKFRRKGGIICVVSHSYKTSILRDYKENGLPDPDMVFGWEMLPHQRKPSVYPLEEIMQNYGLSKSELLVVDDLKPGHEMARNCGVDFAAAGWAHSVPEIDDYMKKNSDFYFSSVEDMDQFLFGNIQ
ncbi:HAD family hydrolase [Parasporobacterium paucivorans]|uniref:Phosphoglycolate phosphatase n=1 Tax=Parasporobacterium paucivorans DSM 15970 TaxID=1122934 RepID=A0A1M6DUM2_9FIRM|nr:HAD hydrolase-like protein [Parasporobacterium paucivorans]SHI76830.1 phosphoglycolate phosphatase [Parasporobacterium paucivorans DSM 15970]